MKTIYVGNLPYGVGDHQLELAFISHGAVAHAHVIKDRGTGRSRGFGFVEMPDDSEADAAVAALNGSNMHGRTLVVNEACPHHVHH